jgi:hypothetical protein
MTTAKQFAWCYLLEHGEIGVKHAYYGGYDLADKNDPDASLFNGYSGLGLFKAKKLEVIKRVGINWDKTCAPDSDYTSTFQGTFCESARVEIITGTLVLNDGSRLYCTSDSIDVSNVFAVMADTQKLVDKYKDLL